MNKSEFKTYGSHQRGERMQLGENMKIRFSDLLPEPFFAQIQVVDFNGDPDEKGLALVKALEKTNAFQKGYVFYVPSPDELRNKQKKDRQAKAALEMRNLLSQGLLTLNLKDSNIQDLRDLASKIGATMKDKKGRDLSPMPLKNAICAVLGINPFKTKGYIEGVDGSKKEASPSKPVTSKQNTKG